MELIIERTGFLKILQRTQGIVEKRNTMPVLANVLLEAKSGKVTIMATDLEIFIKDATESTIKKEGSITINARKLFEIIKEMPEETINISSEGEKITLRSGKARFNILGLSPKEFPPFPSFDDKELDTIEPDILRDMVDKTSFAVSTDETRYHINGFLLERDKTTTRMVTTDGHRLAIVEKQTKKMPDQKQGVILPRKGVAELRKLFEEKEATFQLGISDKSVTMKKGDTTINIRLIEGEFPDFKQVIPKDNDKQVIANRTGLLAALKRVSILSSEKIKGVKFTLTKDKLVLSSSSPEIGDATEELDIEYKDDDMEIAFNAAYFVDALEAADEENVLIELKDAASPGLLRAKEKSEYQYIIMPMRLTP